MTLPRQTLESQASAILSRLQGYMHRQEWTKTDRQFLADLLQEWDEQVTTLVYERTHLVRKCEQLAELNKRNEWRLAGKGWTHYLKFLAGVVECPSR